MSLDSTQLDYSILAEALKSEGAIGIFKENLIADAVGKVNHSYGIYQLYKNIVKCHEEIGSVDFETFGIWLESFPDLYDKMGGKESYDKLVVQLKDMPSVSAPLLVKLANSSYHRSVINRDVGKLKELLSDDMSDMEDVETVYTGIQNKIHAARGRQNIQIRNALDIAAEADELWEVVPFIPTQFKGLNKELGYDKDKGGVMRGNIYSIVATSGLGKSTLVKSMCNHWLDNGMKVLFINFEEARDHWERILMTQVTGQNVYNSYDLDSIELSKLTKKFKAKMNEWGRRFMVRHDPDSLYYEDLEAWLRDLYSNQEEDRPDIVVIDTIQSLFTKTGGGARWGEFEQIMVKLEKLAKDMNAVFILTAQQNSNALKEKRSQINQSDVGGGVTIVQKSSVVMVLMPREDKLDVDSLSNESATPVMEIHMPKNRITGSSSGKNPPLIKYDDDLKLYQDYDLATDMKYANQPLNDFNSIDPTIGIV